MNAVTNFLDSGYKYFITNSSMIIKDFKSSFIPFAKQHPLFSSASVSFVTASAIDRLAYKLFRKLIHKHRPAEILAHVTTIGLIVAGAYLAVPAVGIYSWQVVSAIALGTLSGMASNKILSKI